jgi:hypothetical protein
VVVPSPQNPDAPTRSHEAGKPLPEPNLDPNPRPFDDPPLVVDIPAEARAFAKAWREVGRPRIALFVNRTLEGDIVPTKNPRPWVEIDRSRAGSVVQRDNVKVFLKPGEYDEARAKSVDYAMIENLLTDWMSADNQVEMISPTMARKRLSDEQVKELQAGRPRALSEIAQQLDCDIFVQAQARPTRQTRYGLEVRVIAEAMNVRGGQSIARAAVDIPPPLEKPQINVYTRFLARKLMDGMMGYWSAQLGPEPATKPVTPPGGVAPPPPGGR